MIEQAQGFNIGPATTVGVVAALVILLLTFGSLIAAGMPLVTAGFGLVTGLGARRARHPHHDMSNVAPELAVMIGLGVGIDYALFIVTRFKENYGHTGDVQESIDAGDGHLGPCDPPRRHDGDDRAAGHVRHRRDLHVRTGDRVRAGGPARAGGLADRAAGAALALGGTGSCGPRRRARRRIERGEAPRESAWRRWSLLVQTRPWPLAVASSALMLVFLIPVLGLRLDSSDAGNDPSSTSTYRAYNLLANGFGPGFNGPLQIVVQMPIRQQAVAAAGRARGGRRDAGRRRRHRAAARRPPARSR